MIEKLVLDVKASGLTEPVQQSRARRDTEPTLQREASDSLNRECVWSGCFTKIPVSGR
jgi:hypothetical protein